MNLGNTIEKVESYYSFRKKIFDKVKFDCFYFLFKLIKCYIN